MTGTTGNAIHVAEKNSIKSLFFPVILFYLSAPCNKTMYEIISISVLRYVRKLQKRKYVFKV